MKRDASVNRACSFFKNKPASQNWPARFQLSPCNTEINWREITTDYQGGFTIVLNNVRNYRWVDSSPVITHLFYLCNLFTILVYWKVCGFKILVHTLCRAVFISKYHKNISKFTANDVNREILLARITHLT